MLLGNSVYDGVIVCPSAVLVGVLAVHCLHIAGHSGEILEARFKEEGAREGGDIASLVVVLALLVSLMVLM